MFRELISRAGPRLESKREREGSEARHMHFNAGAAQNDRDGVHGSEFPCLHAVATATPPAKRGPDYPAMIFLRCPSAPPSRLAISKASGCHQLSPRTPSPHLWVKR